LAQPSGLLTALSLRLRDRSEIPAPVTIEATIRITIEVNGSVRERVPGPRKKPQSGHAPCVRRNSGVAYRAFIGPPTLPQAAPLVTSDSIVVPNQDPTWNRSYFSNLHEAPEAASRF
jgi:hypothetical protein